MKKPLHLPFLIMAIVMMMISPQRTLAAPEEEKVPTSHTHIDADDNGICDQCKAVITEDPVLVTDANYTELGLDAKFIGYKAISNRAQLAGFAEEMNAPMTVSEKDITVNTTLHEGNNTISLSVGEGIEFEFTPTKTTTYHFRMDGVRMGLSLNKRKPNMVVPAVASGNDFTYSCQQGQTYYLIVQNTGSTDLVNATLSITDDNLLSKAGYIDTDAPETEARNAAPYNAASRKAASRKVPIINTPATSIKYVLTDDIVVNSNILDKKGNANIKDADGELRELLSWHSPNFYLYEDEEYTKPMEVIFDGNGKTISGLYQIESYSEVWADIVGFIADMNSESQLLNLGIKDSYFTDVTNSSYLNMGSLLGWGEGKVENCWSEATVDGSTCGAYIGGLIGQQYGGSVKGCSFSGNINLDDFLCGVGGLIGYVYVAGDDSIIISDSHFSGTAVNNYRFSSSSVFSPDEIWYNNNCFGGLVGDVSAYDSLAINRCYADGKVVNNTLLTIGGVLGYVSLGDNNGSLTLLNSYNAMKVTSGYQNYRIGGIVGEINQNAQEPKQSGIACCFSYGKYDDAYSSDNANPLIVTNNTSDLSLLGNIYLSEEEKDDEAKSANTDLRKVRKAKTKLPSIVGAPADGFASGVLAFEFNYINQGLGLQPTTNADPVWYQDLGTDPYPVLSGDEWTEVLYEMGENYLICYNKERKLEEYELADGEQYDNKHSIAVADLTYNRTFDNNDFDCLYVPFSAPAKSFTDCTIYAVNMFQQHDTNSNGVFDSADELVLEVVKAPQNAVLLANHPYLIKYNGSQTGTEQTFSFMDAVIEPAAATEFTCSSMNTSYKFKGTYSKISAAKAAGAFTIGTDDMNSSVLAKAAQGIAPQRWYMTMSSRSSQLATIEEVLSSKSIRIVVAGEDIATGIEDVNFDNAQFAKDGKYITNGRIVIFKNGMRYNANGQALK